MSFSHSDSFCVEVNNLGKCYRIHKNLQSRGLRHLVEDAFRFPFRVLGGQPIRTAPTEIHDHWALRGLSFQVKEGEIIGVVGHNGAGKSTFLKLLSRVTSPTEGRIRIRGRVTSLIEVGSGFHHELSGRENVFVNASILGMSIAETKKAFDQIVEYAQVAEFIDMPVKRYSTGMMVRLAFAVAAHLVSEILIVDEVLAVGDAQFQKKSIDRMKEIASEGGRTVFFVSHNMSIIQSLCSRVLLLDHGRLVMEGTPREAVGRYLSKSTQSTFLRAPQTNGNATLIRGAVTVIHGEKDVRARISTTIFSPIKKKMFVGVYLRDPFMITLGYGDLGYFNDQTIECGDGETSIEIEMDVSRLAVGQYNFYLVLGYSVGPNLVQVDQGDAVLYFDLTRPPLEGQNRALEQNWGGGSAELEFTRVS